ncbi:hypothetical protein [Spiroplasma endosymbiont of Labia minor]|uniref:hypothetical protein n=1 Tax=Spiroplasma endosymbiont of Labia minor TaxID=3066305 RepID=UPI0030CD39A1
MKKILTLLSGISIASTSASTIISCEIAKEILYFDDIPLLQSLDTNTYKNSNLWTLLPQTYNDYENDNGGYISAFYNSRTTSFLKDKTFAEYSNNKNFDTDYKDENIIYAIAYNETVDNVKDETSYSEYLNSLIPVDNSSENKIYTISVKIFKFTKDTNGNFVNDKNDQNQLAQFILVSDNSTKNNI